jgi:phosphocarrier protein
MSADSDPPSEDAILRVATGSALLRHETGLHARPAVKLTKLAKRFSARIEFSPSPDGPWIDAKSIVKVLAAKTSRDTLLHFRAKGEDAKAAVEALVQLVEQDFPDDR